MSTARKVIAELIGQGCDRKQVTAYLIEQLGYPRASAFTLVWRLWAQLTRVAAQSKEPRSLAIELLEKGAYDEYLRTCCQILNNVDKQGFVSAEQMRFLHCKPWIKWLYTPGNLTEELRGKYRRLFSD